MSQNNVNQKLNDLLVSKNFDPQSLNNQGKPAESPAEADLFSFNYQGESGHDYGTVVIMITDDNDLNVYFGDNIGKTMEPDDKKGWFDFLYQLRMFAKRNLSSFTLQNLNKLKYSMQGQAAINKGLFESWQGKKDISYNAEATQARLMIKHKRNIGEGEARFRNIQSLFIETEDGERFKLPFTKLSAGRAMLEHVKQGGKPYDLRGNHIASIVEEMNLLSRFHRASHNKIFEGETQQLVEQAKIYYETLQNKLKSLSSKSGYAKYFEHWDPALVTEEDIIIEDLRHMFIEQNIDSRIEQALPLLAKLQREHKMKEANIFENWTNLILEGTWAVPDTKEKQAALVTLLSKELPVGADATNATELLYDLLGDDILFDRLEELADQDANADAREIILTRLEQMKSNPSVAQVIGQIKNTKPDYNEPVDEAYLEEGQLTIGDTVECPNGITGEIIADEGDRWVVRDLHSEFEDDTLEFRKSDCMPAVQEAVKDPYTQTEDPPNTKQPQVKPNTLSEDEVSPVESAIINRIMRAHPDLLSKFGPEAIMNAAREQAEFIGNVDEIGSSDVSGWVNNVIRDLESTSNQQIDELSPDTLKSYVKKASSDRAMRNFDQGVDMGQSMHKREPDFGSPENSRKDDRRRKGIHKAIDRLEESAMSEVDLLLQDIAQDRIDIYDVYAHPKSNIEKFVSQQIHDKVNEITIETGLHGKDDIEKILQIIYDDLQKDYGVEETVGGGNWMEDRGNIVDQITKIQDEIEKIVRSGGRVPLNDPLSRKLKMLKAQLHKSKNVSESTALTGAYGHSGKLEPVEGTDEDMMARIKFLAGIKETDAKLDNKEDTNLTTMKSISSIFIR